ncbi:MAG: hypothetical protein GY769_05065 [bacterium]|nr:hypothetical protein [bacterium]
MGSRPSADEARRLWRRRILQLLSPRTRTWVLTVPLHLLAFVILYFATARIMETEIRSLAGDAASDRLERVERELNEIAVAHVGTAEGGHVFHALLLSQRDINLQLFLPGGSFVGSQVKLSEQNHREIIDFFRGDETRLVWLSDRGGEQRLRGLRRIEAGPSCIPCHERGETLAVATMSMDLTRIVGRLRSHSRRNLGILIIAWGTLLGAINILVKKSVERSAARLEASLAAAEAGEPESADSSQLVLDHATDRLHRALNHFLDRQRRRQAEVAERLEHSDQLASLGQLAAGLAHEIKNPLAGIQGAIEILREDNHEQRTGMLYDDMLGELKRVNTTLQLLLESARPSPPQLAMTDPEVLIKETVYLLRPGLSRRGVALRYEIAPDTGQVRVDSAKIRQVLINLIQNAAEAMDEGGSIVLRAGKFPEAEGGLILAVEDDGPGISEEQQEKIFEPFFTTKFSGTGLGLAIAHRLVEQHGGSLELDSEPGRGSTFYVLLPAAVPVPPPADASEPSSGE